jgi:hypothetical protein
MITKEQASEIMRLACQISDLSVASETAYCRGNDSSCEKWAEKADEAWKDFADLVKKLQEE